MSCKPVRHIEINGKKVVSKYWNYLYDKYQNEDIADNAYKAAVLVYTNTNYKKGSYNAFSEKDAWDKFNWLSNIVDTVKPPYKVGFTDKAMWVINITKPKAFVSAPSIEDDVKYYNPKFERDIKYFKGDRALMEQEEGINSKKNGVSFTDRLTEIKKNISKESVKKELNITDSNPETYIKTIGNAGLKILINKVRKGNKNVKVVYGETNNFNPATNTVMIDIKEAKALSTINGKSLKETLDTLIAHEFVHAGLYSAAHTHPEIAKQLKVLHAEFIKADKNNPFIDKLRNNYRREDGGSYQYDYDEFIADISNPEFVSYLKKVNVSLFTQLINAIKRALNNAFGTEFKVDTIYDKITKLLFDEDMFIENQAGVDNKDSFMGIKLRGLIQASKLNPNDSNIQYSLKSIRLLQSDKAKLMFIKGTKSGWTLDKTLNEIGGFANYKQLFNEEDLNKKVSELNREELAVEIAGKYSYTVEINTAKELISDYSNTGTYIEGDYEFTKKSNGTYWKEHKSNFEDRTQITKEEYASKYRGSKNTSHYSNLSVPGGTNYTENEIATPAITPSIKGHAQFSTDNGIGWFRSDDKNALNKKSLVEADPDTLSPEEFEEAKNDFKASRTSTKTRRILEVQSDLFQKGRNEEELIEGISGLRNGKYFTNHSRLQENQFLQLLNKNNNWVRFFIQSIIQDSAKKGYEKVLFPVGDTAAKIEGHETVSGFIEQKEGRIKELNEINKNLDTQINPNILPIEDVTYLNKREQKELLLINNYEIQQLEKEIEDAKAGKLKISSIANFYETTIGNILNKDYKGSVERISDEYGNGWYQLNLGSNISEDIFLGIPQSEKDDVDNTTYSGTVEAIKDVLKTQKAIYRKKKNGAKLVADIEALEKNISENKSEIESVNYFIDEANTWTTNASNKFNKLLTVLKGGVDKLTEVQQRNALELIHELKEFASAYTILDDIENQYFNSFDNIDESEQSKKLTNAIKFRNKINSEYKKYGNELITEWIYKQAESTNANFIKADKADRVLTKADIKKQLTLASEDMGVFEKLFGAAIDSQDPILALVAKGIKDVLEDARIKDLNTQNELVDLYNKESGNKNNVNEFNKQFLQEIENYEIVGEDEDGNSKWDYVKRTALVTEYDTATFEKDKRDFFKKLGPKPDNDKALKAWNIKIVNWFNANTKVIANPKELVAKKKAELSEDKFYQWLKANTKEVIDTVYHDGASKSDYIEDYKIFEKSNGKIYLYSGDFIQPSDNYKNLRYNSVKDNKYYQKLLSTYTDANYQLTPSKQLRHGIIPQLRKEAIEAIYAGDDKKELIKHKLKENYSVQANDENIYGVQTLSGEDYKTIPVYYTTLIDEKELSHDLLQSVLNFSSMSNNFDALYSIQPQIEVIQDINKDRKVTDTNSKGITLLNAVTGKTKTKSGESLLKERLQAFIDMAYYGESTKAQTVNILGKEISIDKIAGKLQGFTALSSMALGVTSAISNATYGNFQVFNEGAGGQYYNKKDWAVAFGKYQANLPAMLASINSRTANTKITKLMDLFDAIQGNYKDSYGKDISGTAAKRLFKTDSLFFLNHGTEHQIQGTGMLAILNNHKVKDSNGNEISLFDAYDDNAKLKDGIEFSDKDRKEVINKIHSINKKLHGNYNKFDAPTIQRFWYGKMAMMFRKHIYGGITRRYGREQINYELGDVTEGYYRSFIKSVMRDWKNYKGNVLLYGKDATPAEKAARVKVITDLAFLATSLLVAGALGGDDDDDEKNTWFQSQVDLQTRRFNADIAFYFVANSDFLRIAKNPTVVLGTGEKVIRFLDQLIFTWDPDKLVYQRKSGIHERGDNKSWAKLKGILPVYRAVEAFASPEEQLTIYQK